jgi:ERCC4-type nuclease
VIYIDDRTGSVEMAAYFQSHRTHPAIELKRLPAADFAFSGNGPTGPCMIGIERKRTKDMLSSIRTGRFSGEQLPKLLDHYEFAFLLVEGWSRTNYQTGELEEWWGKKWCAVHLGSQRQAFLALELDSFLSTIELHTRVRVHRTLNERATTEDVINLQGYFAKPWDKHHAHIALHTPPEFATLGKAGTVRRVAAALNGVGWTRSAAVADRFTSVEEMVLATVKDWQKVDGFGKVLSKKVWQELHGETEGGDGID